MLQEKDLNQIAQLAGIDADTLKSAISSENETELTITKTKSYSDTEYSTLENNIGKTKYDEGKVVGVEMAVKDYKRSNNIEADGRTIESVVDAMKQKLSTNDNEQITELNNDKLKLQNQITELQQLGEKKAGEINAFKANMIVESEINKIPFAVPDYVADEQKDAYIQAERNKAKLLFNNTYSIDFDSENNAILKKGGEVVKDELQNAAKVGSIIPNFAKSNYFAMESQETKIKGRGTGNSTIKNDFGTIKTTSELIDYAEKKGVKKGTPEMDALFAEFNKNK